MSKVVSGRDMIRRLEAEGWVLDHVSGGHQVFRHPTRRGAVVVPHTRKSLKRGMQQAILKQTGLPA